MLPADELLRVSLLRRTCPNGHCKWLKFYNCLDTYAIDCLLRLPTVLMIANYTKIFLFTQYI